MVMGFTNFKSFEEVVKHYEDTKPIKEQEHGTSRNIRPIGDRSRKWETIQKMSRNCYVLSCGYERGNELSVHWGYASTSPEHMKMRYQAKLENYAPVVWRKHKDGSTSVKINNMCGAQDYGDISHYSFLARNLPDGMELVEAKGNAHRYIRTLIDHSTEHMRFKLGFTPVRSTDVFLAKKRTVPRGEYERRDTDSEWYQWMTPKDDNSSLVFVRSEGNSPWTNWVHDKTTGQKPPQPPRINKSVKAKYVDYMKQFYDWGMTMTPLLPLKDLEYVSDKITELMEYSDERFKTKNRYGTEPDYKLVREILRQEQHPYRLNFWLLFVRSTNDGWSIDPRYAVWIKCKEDAVRVRARYNRFINKVAQFMEKK